MLLPCGSRTPSGLAHAGDQYSYPAFSRALLRSADTPRNSSSCPHALLFGDRLPPSGTLESLHPCRLQCPQEHLLPGKVSPHIPARNAPRAVFALPPPRPTSSEIPAAWHSPLVWTRPLSRRKRQPTFLKAQRTPSITAFASSNHSAAECRRQHLRIESVHQLY